MKLKKRLYYNLAYLFPREYKDHVEGLLRYTHRSIPVNIFLGNIMFYALFLTFLLYLLFSLFVQHFHLVHWLFLIALFFTVHLLFYILLYLKSEKIKDEIESVLPDALQVIASHLEAGSTPFQAIKGATRKEFGVLGKMFDQATKRVLASENFGDALKKIAEQTNSTVFKRSIKLITASLKTGGNLSQLLHDLAQDISERRSLKLEMITNTKTYSMFIMFTIIVGAPLLFAISIHFVTIVNNLQSTAQLTTSEFGLGFLAGGLDITPEFLTKVAYVSLFFISLFACLMMGVITSGKAKLGLKYAPLLVGGSLIVFLIAKKVIVSMFGGLV